MAGLGTARSAIQGGETPAARALRVGFGTLWLLDGVLQAQPGMFTMDMVSTIMQPAATGQPAWLAALIAWSIRLVTPHVVVFNALVVALQLAIGILLLCGGRPRLVRAGAALGLVWGLVIWLFGEGLGQLLTGSASALSGAPGSALLYALAAGMLLAAWPAGDVRAAGRSLATLAVVALFALTLALQGNPLFFHSLGLASLFGQGAMMTQPHVVDAPIRWLTDVSGAHPGLVNGMAIAVVATAALAAPWTTRGRLGLALLAGLVALLFAEWWLGQDFGMPFSGMATDPNTAAPAFVLLLSGYLADRALRADAAAAEPADDAPPTSGAGAVARGA